MRHNTMNDHETPLASGTMDDRTRGADISPETIDNLILRARQMRAEATAQLLSRLGGALVRRFRHSTPSKNVGAHDMIKGGPQGAV